MKPASYDHPIGGQYNETVAKFEDGRIATINTQYRDVCVHGEHEDVCRHAKIGGRCTCERNADIMSKTDEILNDARENGKFGLKPAERMVDAEESAKNAQKMDDDYNRIIDMMTLGEDEHNH